jgi:hypothetical protein
MDDIGVDPIRLDGFSWRFFKFGEKIDKSVFSAQVW